MRKPYNKILFTKRIFNTGTGLRSVSRERSKRKSHKLFPKFVCETNKSFFENGPIKRIDTESENDRNYDIRLCDLIRY